MTTTLNYTGLGDIQQLGNSAGVLIENPADTVTYIKGVTLHNTGATPEVVELYFVPDSTGSAGSAATANRCYKATIASEDTVLFEWPGLGICLAQDGDSLQGKSTTAATVNIMLHGDTAE